MRIAPNRYYMIDDQCAKRFFPHSSSYLRTHAKNEIILWSSVCFTHSARLCSIVYFYQMTYHFNNSSILTERMNEIIFFFRCSIRLTEWCIIAPSFLIRYIGDAFYLRGNYHQRAIPMQNGFNHRNWLSCQVITCVRHVWECQNREFVSEMGKMERN